MMIRHMAGAACALALLSGCSAPVVKGDSLQNQKQLSFPAVGQRSTAAVGTVAVLHSSYQSRILFRLETPVRMTTMLLGRIEVSKDDRLIQSDFDGVTLYCTERNAYVDPIEGPSSRVCFRPGGAGKFASVKYQSGMAWLSKDLPAEIGYTSMELADQGQTTPLKRELVFDGSANGTLMFTERIYEKSLETPSRLKPLMASAASLPAKAILDGMDINVLHADGKTLTFEVIRPWQ